MGAIPHAMKTALARHDVIMRGAIETRGGYVFKTVGDAFCAAFATAPDALSAALAAQRRSPPKPGARLARFVFGWLSAPARPFGAAEALREAIGVPLPPSDRPDYDRSVAAVRAGLGDEAFAKTWAEGRKMALEEAIEYALSDRR